MNSTLSSLLLVVLISVLIIKDLKRGWDGEGESRVDTPDLCKKKPPNHWAAFYLGIDTPL